MTTVHAHVHGAGHGIDNDCPSTIEIAISCTNLLDKDVFSRSDPLCVIYNQPIGLGLWEEILRTEVIWDNLDPVFAEKLVMDYKCEEEQKLRFEVYDVDAPSKRLEDHDFLGFAECTLPKIVDGGYAGLSLLLCQNTQVNYDDKDSKDCAGVITLVPEKLIPINQEVTLQLAGELINSKYFGLHGSRVFFTMSKGNVTGRSVLVYKSESVSNRMALWTAFTFNLARICGGDRDRGLKIQCFRRGLNGYHTTIGSTETTINKLTHLENGYILSLTNADGKKTRSRLLVLQCKLTTIPTLANEIPDETQSHIDDLSMDTIYENLSENVPTESDSSSSSQHFNCSECDLSIHPAETFLLNNKRSCRSCFLKKFKRLKIGSKCFQCHQPFPSLFHLTHVLALSSTNCYHKECFNCTSCSKNLIDCGSAYNLSKALTESNSIENYCKDCFCCTICGDFLETSNETKFYVDKMICNSCVVTEFGQVCSKCSIPFSANDVCTIHHSKIYHRSCLSCCCCYRNLTGVATHFPDLERNPQLIYCTHCFRCTECSRYAKRFPLDKLFFLADTHKIICDSCMKTKFNVNCVKCHEQFEPSVRDCRIFEGNVFHVKCFTCKRCEKNIQEGKFRGYSTSRSTSPNPYCSNCFNCDECGLFLMEKCRAFEFRDKLFCKSCLVKNFGPQCYECKVDLRQNVSNLTVSKLFFADGKIFHQFCFKCQHCRTSLENIEPKNVQTTKMSKQNFCSICFERILREQKCSTCHKLIGTTGSSFTMSQGNYCHDDCASDSLLDCSICLSEIEASDCVRLDNGNCIQHLFHKECLLKWVTLKRSEGRTQIPCPLCNGTSEFIVEGIWPLFNL